MRMRITTAVLLAGLAALGTARAETLHERDGTTLSANIDGMGACKCPGRFPRPVRGCRRSYREAPARTRARARADDGGRA